jgi:branched-chain amino acid transport system ATP-binding protein
MLALGRGQMSEQKLLTLDEPSLGLSPAVVESLYERLQLPHSEGLTLLLAEQSIQLALEIADSAADLEDNEQVREIYLGIAKAMARRET